MRASIDLAKMGNQVYLIEKENSLGGNIAKWNDLFITGQKGKTITETLEKQIRALSNIHIFTHATVVKVSGSLGNFMVSCEDRAGRSESEDRCCSCHYRIRFIQAGRRTIRL